MFGASAVVPVVGSAMMLLVGTVAVRTARGGLRRLVVAAVVGVGVATVAG